MKTTTDSWYFKNKEYAQAYQKEYRLKNTAKFNSKSAKRRSIKKTTSSDLSKQELSQIENLYLYAQMLTNFSGIAHHVDHIIPLNGDKEQGTHCFSNLRIVTALYNTKKTNDYVEYSLETDCEIFKNLNSSPDTIKTSISSKSACKTVVCYETGKEFFSIKACADFHECLHSNISSVVNGKKLSYKGLHFYLKSDSYKLEDLKKQWEGSRKNTIRCIETGEVFYTYKQAAKFINVNQTTIRLAIEAGRPCKGFNFETLDNKFKVKGN